MRHARLAAPALAALMLAACATTAPAPKADRTAAYFAQDFTCQPTAAKQLELADLRRAPQRYDGACVTVLGFAKADLLFNDARDADTANAETRIGLDWQDDALAHRLRLGPSFVVLTGRVRLCSRRRAMIALAAPATPETGCRDAVAALTVSAAKIIPTAMD